MSRPPLRLRADGALVATTMVAVSARVDAARSLARALLVAPLR